VGTEEVAEEEGSVTVIVGSGVVPVVGEAVSRTPLRAKVEAAVFPTLLTLARSAGVVATRGGMRGSALGLTLMGGLVEVKPEPRETGLGGGGQSLYPRELTGQSSSPEPVCCVFSKPECRLVQGGKGVNVLGEINEPVVVVEPFEPAQESLSSSGTSDIDFNRMRGYCQRRQTASERLVEKRQSRSCKKSSGKDACQA